MTMRTHGARASMLERWIFSFGEIRHLAMTSTKRWCDDGRSALAAHAKLRLGVLGLLSPATLLLGSVTVPDERRYEFYQPTVEHVTLHEGKIAPGHYAYNHMVSVEWFDGQFHAVWGGNATTYAEGKPGQFNVWATSGDFRRWTMPEQLAHVGLTPLPVDPQVVEWQPNLLNYRGQQLWCIWYAKSRDGALQGTYLSILEKGAGNNWRHRKIFNRHEVHGVPCIAFPSQNPVLLSSGRVLAPVTLFPDDRFEKGEQFADQRSAQQKFRRWNACLFSDDGGETWKVSDPISMVDDAVGQWEPFFYEQADGQIRAYMRNFTKGTPPGNQWRLTTTGTGAAKGTPVRFPSDPIYSFMETINERPQVLRLPGGRYCLIQQDAYTNHRDYRTRVNVALNFSRSGADDFVAGPPVSRPGVISRYAQGVEHGGSLYIGYTLGPGESGPGPELAGMEGAIVTPAPRADRYYVWPRRKELVTMATTADAAGNKTVRRANPNARTASPRLLDGDRLRTLAFADRASAGVDIDPVDFAAGETLEIRFDTKVARVQEVGMLVLCSLGDRIPIRLGVPANRPGKLYAYTRNQWEPVADFAPDQWHSLRVVIKGGEFSVTVDGLAAITYPNPIVNPPPRVYLGDGFEVDYIRSNSGSEFHIALDSLVTKVAR